MTRTTIVLDSSLKKRVMKKARELEISMGELIRISLDKFLKEPSEVVSTADSFFSDNVSFKDDKGVTDLSINHDQHLYED
jgi:hypothetical protein